MINYNGFFERLVMKFTTLSKLSHFLFSAVALLGFIKCNISLFNFYNFCLIYTVYPSLFTHPQLPASLPQPPFTPLWGFFLLVVGRLWAGVYDLHPPPFTPPPHSLPPPPPPQFTPPQINPPS